MSERIVATADEFLTSPKLERAKQDVPVPELGEGKVLPIWGMTPRERTAWDDRISLMNKAQRKQFKKRFRERLLVECCRNDDGSQVFTLSQVETLSERRGDVVERLINVAADLSGFTSQDLDDVVKNSDASQED